MSKKALNAHKLTEGIHGYARKMGRNSDSKQDFFSSKIESVLLETGRPIRVLDVGCCAGELTGRIKERFRDAVNINGVDLSPNMIELAREAYPGIIFSVGNAYSLDVPECSVDVIIYSSILHELGSYFGETHNFSSYNRGIEVGLERSKIVLSQGGHLLVKDPVMPNMKDKPVIIIPSQKTREQKSGRPSEQNLLASPNEMDYLSRVKYFIDIFPWFSGTVLTSGDRILCTLKDVNEIARHTSDEICDSWHHFMDETKEWYGSWNKEDWEKYSSQEGNLKLVNNKTVFSFTNHSVEFYRNFAIYDMEGNKIIPDNLLPTHQFTELRKI